MSHRAELLLVWALCCRVLQSSAMDVRADAEVIVKNGTTGILPCSFTSNQVVSSATSVIWSFRSNQPDHKFTEILHFKNGKSFPAVGEFKERLRFIGDFNKRDVSVELGPVRFSDSGSYICRVYNLHDQLVKHVQTELRVVRRDEPSTNTSPGESPTTLVLISACVVVIVIISVTVLMIYCRRRSR